MSATPPAASRSSPLSLDDVILLNDEIQGLIAAGIPLDVGLAGFASRVRGRLRRFSARLSERVAAGVPLEQALQAEAAALPGEYQVVLAAGMRSGRFDVALASVARYASSLRELRAGLRRALIYPGVVCGLAFSLLAGIFAFLVPMLLENVDELGLPHAGWYPVLAVLHRTVPYWGLGIPGLLLLTWIAVQVARWVGSGESGESSAAQRFLGGWRWIPGVGGALRAAHWSRFAHLLAVLIEADVPLVEAAQLSAAAVGDSAVTAAIARCGPRLSGGQSLADALDDRCGVPPLLRWLMRWGEREATLAPALREAAAQYEQRALFRAELVARFMPLAIVAIVGGGITAAYALTVFVPLTSMWQGLANSG